MNDKTLYNQTEKKTERAMRSSQNSKFPKTIHHGGHYSSTPSRAKNVTDGNIKKLSHTCADNSRPRVVQQIMSHALHSVVRTTAKSNPVNNEQTNNRPYQTSPRTRKSHRVTGVDFRKICV